ncbi:hypothetical protein JHK85_044431 [Glycine max]|nr:hypothetical protein JHK85_044431 [Glycine max]
MERSHRRSHSQPIEVFLSSLKGPALTWWHQLHPLTINTFNTLAERFGAQFTTCRPHHMMSVAQINCGKPTTNHCRTSWEDFQKLQFRSETSNLGYHRKYGHSTEECIVLKDKIEELVQKGCLNDFIRGNNFNHGEYHGGRGGCLGGYRGGYIKGHGNYNQQQVEESEQQQQETFMGKFEESSTPS